MSGDGLKTFVITGLYSGFLRPANATWGSAVATLLFAAPALATLHGRLMPRILDGLVLFAIMVACVAAVRWGGWAIARFGSDDPRPFVLDEFAGQWIALLFLPPAAWSDATGLGLVLFGKFFLFRVFDILKLPPARQLEDLPAGWGILCDDLMAVLFANVAGQLAWRWSPLAAWLGIHTEVVGF